MDFKHEKEERKAAAEKARLESDKQVELSKLVEFLMVEVEMVVVVVVKVVEVVVMEVLVIVVSCVEAMTAPE